MHIAVLPAARALRSTPAALSFQQTLLMSAAATTRMVTPEDFPSTFDNSLLRELRGEPPGKDPHESREVTEAHYTRVPPTVSAPKPALVAFAPDVAASIGLDPAACKDSAEFLQLFAGQLPKGIETWATCYGASFAGNYGGQRGDGRAVTLGMVRRRTTRVKRNHPLSRSLRKVLPDPRVSISRLFVLSCSPLRGCAMLARRRLTHAANERRTRGAAQGRRRHAILPPL